MRTKEISRPGMPMKEHIFLYFYLSTYVKKKVLAMPENFLRAIQSWHADERTHETMIS
jgi:hypothetical protein